MNSVVAASAVPMLMSGVVSPVLPSGRLGSDGTAPGAGDAAGAERAFMIPGATAAPQIEASPFLRHSRRRFFAMAVSFLPTFENKVTEAGGASQCEDPA